MNAQPPVTERPVPEAVATRVRDRLMADAGPAAPRRRLRGLGVAAAVVVLVGGSGPTLGHLLERDLVAAPPSPVETSGDRIVPTDLGPLSPADTDTTLVGCRRAGDPALDQVITARRLSDGETAFGWVAYRNVDDQVVTCSDRGNGPTYGGDRKHLPTVRYPVVPLGGMTSGSWLPDQSSPSPTVARDYSTAQLFAAGPGVDTVQLRVVVAGRPGAWFAGQVSNGFVLVPLFDAGPVPLDAHGEPQVSFERRAFDSTGAPVSIKG